MDYRSINSKESGLSVRTKLNNMLAALISGKEGANSIWETIDKINSDFEDFQDGSERQNRELNQQILGSFKYTDTIAENLRTYVNGMNGGISGFAEDTTFNPNFPLDKAATVLAVGAGTYVNMLDREGVPITIIDEDALIVFYKGANSAFWQYRVAYARVVFDENIDGGNASTNYGGSKNINGGRAY